MGAWRGHDGRAAQCESAEGRDRLGAGVQSGGRGDVSSMDSIARQRPARRPAYATVRSPPISSLRALGNTWWRQAVRSCSSSSASAAGGKSRAQFLLERGIAPGTMSLCARGARARGIACGLQEGAQVRQGGGLRRQHLCAHLHASASASAEFRILQCSETTMGCCSMARPISYEKAKRRSRTKSLSDICRILSLSGLCRNTCRTVGARTGRAGLWRGVHRPWAGAAIQGSWHRTNGSTVTGWDSSVRTPQTGPVRVEPSPTPIT